MSMLPTTKAKQRIVLDAVIRSLKASPNASTLTLEILALECVLLHLHNRKINPRRRDVSVPMTPQLKRQIRYDFKHTSMNQNELAIKHGVNPGRIADAINGVLH